MAELYLGLGSNLGDKAANLQSALRLLTGSQQSESKLLAVSSLYRTDPVGYLDQDWFLNAAVHIETQLAPHELLTRLIAIEGELGRVRTVRNGPRSIDLDILLWQCLIICDDNLIVPHPRLHERLFVLEPLAEIAPDALHPGLGITVAECLTQLVAKQKAEPSGGNLGVFRIDGPAWAGSLA